MINNATIRLIGQTTSWFACVAAMGFAWPGKGQVAEAVEVFGEVELQIAGDADDELDLFLNAEPGFRLNAAEIEFREEIDLLSKLLADQDWAKAFRLLTELDTEQLQVMVPLGNEGTYVLVKEELQRQLLSLPPEGRRAFRLYFDAQAAEQFEQIKNHPQPGSEAQLVLAQALADRLLASSVGGEAAVLLGDMYFGRGMFDHAERYWRLALEQGSLTGERALEQEAKRALALQRAGKQAEAKLLYDGLQARYGQATLQVGDEEIDALAMLGQMIQSPDAAAGVNDVAAQGNLLPAEDAAPLWHHTILDQSMKNAVNQVRNRGSYYSPPSDLMKFVPPVAADAERVYFHWLGVVIAIDRQSGKIVWENGSLEKTAESVATRVQSNQGDPRNYSIALSDDALLVTTTQNANHDSPFLIKAYGTDDGLVRWSSDTRQDWSIQEPNDDVPKKSAILGQVLVHEGWGYAVVHRPKQTSMYLRRFDPATGEVDWTILLGSAQSMAFQYTQVSRLPQPTLMMGPSLLYVMTNNGAILAVDLIASELKWALRTEPPFGIGNMQGNRAHNNQLGNQIESMANTNGSGRMLMQNQTLYAKEHNGKTLYAIDPATGRLNWSAGQLKPDAKLVGVDDKRFYLMDHALQSYQIDGEHDLIAKNAQLGSPDEAGAILAGQHILVYANEKLRNIDTDTLYNAGLYTNDNRLGNKGGHLYLFGDLLIAIDRTQIAAFKVSDNN